MAEVNVREVFEVNITSLASKSSYCSKGATQVWQFAKDLSDLAHHAWKEEQVFIFGITNFSSNKSRNQLISDDVFKWFK